MIDAYYGVSVPDRSLYVGFAQPEMYEVPLLTTGLEQLYATLNPSPDLSEWQLREILYDHLVTRPGSTGELRCPLSRSAAGIGRVRRALQKRPLGIGRIDPLTGPWRPSLPKCDPSGRSHFH